jgi:hypothetical protein
VLQWCIHNGNHLETQIVVEPVENRTCGTHHRQWVLCVNNL